MKKILLSERLKELRRANGYTQDYVAEVLGVVRQTYSHYETGKRTPDASILFGLSQLYGISLDTLMQLTIAPDTNDAQEASEYSSQNQNNPERDELEQYLDHFNNPQTRKKYQYNTNLERELLYYFEKISAEDKREIIEFTKIKARKKRKNPGN